MKLTIEKRGGPVKIFVFAAFALGSCSFAVADDGQAAGSVSEYSGPREKFSLIRKTSKSAVPIEIGLPVSAGDLIHLDEKGTVVVLLTNGKPVVANTVGDTPIPPSPENGLLYRLLDAWTNQRNPREHYRSAAVPTRSEEDCKTPSVKNLAISAPVSESRVKVGRMDVPVAWSGGCGPFTITLSGKGVAPRSEERFSGNLFVFENVDVTTNRIDIAVKGSKGPTAQTSIVGVNNPPQPPAELMTGTGALGPIAQALWLRENEKPEWRFEALRLIQPLVVEEVGVASELADELLWGAHP